MRPHFATRSGSSALLELDGVPVAQDLGGGPHDVGRAESNVEHRIGADAVLDMRFGTSYIMGSAAEILAYGNAVLLAKE